MKRIIKLKIAKNIFKFRVLHIECKFHNRHKVKKYVENPKKSVLGFLDFVFYCFFCVFFPIYYSVIDQKYTLNPKTKIIYFCPFLVFMICFLDVSNNSV